MNCTLADMPLFAVSVQSEHGRRTQLDDLPARDAPSYVDKGRKGRTYTIRGYTQGNDNAAETRQLVNICDETEGAKVFEHPTHGRSLVVTESLSLALTSANRVEFTIKLTEVSENQFTFAQLEESAEHKANTWAKAQTLAKTDALSGLQVAERLRGGMRKLGAAGVAVTVALAEKRDALSGELSALPDTLERALSLADSLFQSIGSFGDLLQFSEGMESDSSAPIPNDVVLTSVVNIAACLRLRALADNQPKAAQLVAHLTALLDTIHVRLMPCIALLLSETRKLADAAQTATRTVELLAPTNVYDLGVWLGVDAERIIAINRIVDPLDASGAIRVPQ